MNLQERIYNYFERNPRLAVVAEQAIRFDLDDGVVHNYALYGDIFAKLK